MNRFKSTRSPRHQNGSIWLRGKNWFIRFDGPDKKQKTELLCVKDDRFHSKTCKPIKNLASEVMLRVNSAAETTKTVGLTAQEYWTGTYEPFVKKHLRPSTHQSYVHLWRRYFEKQVGPIQMDEWKPVRGTEFLTGLADQVGQRTLQHIKNLASGVWSHALALGKVESNPWRDSKWLVNPRTPCRMRRY